MISNALETFSSASLLTKNVLKVIDEREKARASERERKTARAWERTMAIARQRARKREEKANFLIKK